MIQTDAPICALNGEPMKKGNLTDQFGRVIGADPDSDDFLVRDAVAEALLQDTDAEKEKPTASSAVRRFMLANLFFQHDMLGDADIKDADIVFILERSPRLGALVHGRLHEALKNGQGSRNGDTPDPLDDPEPDAERIPPVEPPPPPTLKI